MKGDGKKLPKVPITFSNKAETTQQSPKKDILSEMEVAPRYTLFALFALLSLLTFLPLVTLLKPRTLSEQLWSKRVFMPLHII